MLAVQKQGQPLLGLIMTTGFMGQSQCLFSTLGLFVLSFFFFFFFSPPVLHPQHVGVPRPGIKTHAAVVTCAAPATMPDP